MNYIGGLSNKRVLGDRPVVRYSDGCPVTVIRKVVEKIILEVCPMNPIGGFSNKGFSEMVQWFDIRRVVQ